MISHDRFSFTSELTGVWKETFLSGQPLIQKSYFILLSIFSILVKRILGRLRIM